MATKNFRDAVCSKCKGRGFVEKPGGDRVVCDECDGKGLKVKSGDLLKK